MKKPIRLSFYICLCLSANLAFADIHLPRLLSEGAVFQREQSNRLWGWARNGEAVSVKLNGKVIGSTTASAGSWAIELPPQAAGGPHRLTFEGQNRIVLSDIYFGDVWLAGGQSNMELPLSRVKTRFSSEIQQLNNAKIRFFRVPKRYEFNKAKKDFSAGSWLPASTEHIANMSAVAWFFSKNIHAETDLPIGIIDNSYGGSAAESWMNEDALAAYPQHLKTARKLQDSNYLKNLIAQDEAAKQSWWNFANKNDPGLFSQPTWFARTLRTDNWNSIEIPSYWQDSIPNTQNGVVWFRKEIILPQSFSSKAGTLELGRIIDADTAWINGIKVGETGYQYPPRIYTFKAGTLRPGKNTITVRITNTNGKGGFVPDKPYVLHVGDTNFKLNGTWKYKIAVQSEALAAPKFENWKQPLGFYNAMLAPLLHTQIKGVIWYQGETNAGRPDEYASLFPSMIRHWREQFKQGDFPFIFVQLANFMEAKAQPEESAWAETRAAQTGALAEPNTAMAVAIDLGEWNDIHPTDKKSVGERLALAARKLVYGENTLVASGPTYQSMKIKGHKVRVYFDNIGKGLSVKGDPKDRSPLGFSIAGEDGKFVWATAKLKKKYVEVWSNDVKKPKYIRYAWADNPDTANLYNQEGLPTVPFHAMVEKQ